MPSAKFAAVNLSELGGWPTTLALISAGEELPPDHAAAALREILAGEATDGQIAAFVMAMRTRGESPAEIVAMVEVMLDNALPIDLGPDHAAAIDIVGTGGAKTGRPALNVSTLASIVVAACGVPVCKHGNRKASSTSGSTDVLAALGVQVELDGAAVARCVNTVGVGFAFARMFHPAMRHAGPVRAELGVPTVFNLLGPLSNPARVTRMVVGVSDRSRARLMVEVLAGRGLTHAMVVSGSDGLDELTLAGDSLILELADGEIIERTVSPADAGLHLADPADLAGGEPGENAAIAMAILGGEPGPRRDIVLFNAAAGLVVADQAPTLSDGVQLAAAAIDDGKALKVLEALVSETNAPTP